MAADIICFEEFHRMLPEKVNTTLIENDKTMENSMTAELLDKVLNGFSDNIN